jgi:hypothetical protein
LSSVGNTSATLNGELNGSPSAESAPVKFRYWKEGNYYDKSKASVDPAMSSKGSFSASASGLENGTTYVIRTAAYTDSEGWKVRNAVEFTTGSGSD